MKINFCKNRKGKLSIFKLIFIVIILVFIFWVPKNLTKEPDTNVPSQAEKELHGPYEVVRVVDGDTVILNINGEKTRVRMIGVDTPESVHPDESRNSKEGETASQFTKDYLTGRSIYLEYDEDLMDDYGRTLAYVFLDKEGNTMYQQILLDEGYAVPMVIEPNTKYFSK